MTTVFKFNPIATPFIPSTDTLPEDYGNTTCSRYISDELNSYSSMSDLWPKQSFSGSESGGSNEDMVQRLKEERGQASFIDVFAFNDSSLDLPGNNAWHHRNDNGSLSPGDKSDRNSTSYGSFQHGSYLSDTWQGKSESEGRSEESELSWRFNEKFKSRFGNREESGDGGYYSPFSTGLYLQPLHSDDDGALKSNSYKSFLSAEEAQTPWSKTPVKSSIAEEGELDDSVCCSLISNMLKSFDEDALEKDFDDLGNDESMLVGGSLNETSLRKECFPSELSSSEPNSWMCNIPNFNSNFLPQSASHSNHANHSFMQQFNKQDQRNNNNLTHQSFLEQQHQQFQQQQQQQQQQLQQQQAEAMKQKYIEALMHNINPEQYLRDAAFNNNNNSNNPNNNMNNLAYNSLLYKKMAGNNSNNNNPQFNLNNLSVNTNTFYNNSPSNNHLNNNNQHNNNQQFSNSYNSNQLQSMSSNLPADLASYYSLLQLQTAKEKQDNRLLGGTTASPLHINNLRNLHSPAQSALNHPNIPPTLKQQFANKHFNAITPQQQMFQQHQQMLQQQQQLRQQQQQLNYINHALSGINYTAARPIKRSGPANELHQRLEECYEQYKNIENERKRTEAELARQNPGKNVSSDNNRPLPPQLSQNPSRVDRLVLETIKEHSRVETLLERMEELQEMRVPVQVRRVVEDWRKAAVKVQACRKDEILNAINKHLIKNPQQQKEKDVLALASSLEELSMRTREARSALWSGLQLCSVDMPRRCMVLASKMAALDVWKNKVEKGVVEGGAINTESAVGLEGDDGDEESSSVDGSDVEEN